MDPSRAALCVAFGAGVVALVPIPATAAVVPARRIVTEEDPLPDGTRYARPLEGKFTAEGEIGVYTRLTPTFEAALVIDDAVVWRSGDVEALPAATVSTDWALGSNGDFLLRPLHPGEYSAVWAFYGPSGRVIGTGDPVPLFPGYVLDAVVGAKLRPDGAASFTGRFDSNGDGHTDYSVLWSASDTTLADPQVMLQAHDVVDGREVDAIHYHDVSDDGSHFIATAGTDALYMLVSDAGVLAVETEAGPAGLWGEFAWVATNDAGSYAWSGSLWNFGDAYVAVDGTVVATESDVLDGVDLAGSPAPEVELSNGGIVLHRWRDAVFVTCDAGASTTLLLRDGDEVDFDADGVADASVGHPLAIDLRDDGRALVTALVSVQDYYPVTVLELAVSCCGNGVVEADEACDGGPGCSAECELDEGGSTSSDGGSESGASSAGGEGTGASSEGGGSSDGAEDAGTSDATQGGSASDAGESGGRTAGEEDAASGDAGGCGCRVRGTPIGALWLLAAFGLRRRRETAARIAIVSR